MHAASPDKIGRDAAELCGLDEPTGVIATDDIDALIALQPDCVVYTAQGETRPMEAIEQMSKFLAAGHQCRRDIDGLAGHPAPGRRLVAGAAGAGLRGGQRLAVCQRHRSGFSGDTAVHSAVSLVTRAKSITVQEIFDYGNYDDYEFTGAAMGFGTTPDDDTPMLFLPGVIMSMWGGLVRNLAEHLDVKLDEVRDRFEPWYTGERIECTMMTVEPGQLAAVRFAAEGCSRRQTGDHPRTHHPAHRRCGTGLGVSARGPDRRAPGGRGGGTAGRDEHPCVPSGSRCHRRRMYLHRGPGGQCDRLGLPRPQRD